MAYGTAILDDPGCDERDRELAVELARHIFDGLGDDERANVIHQLSLAIAHHGRTGEVQPLADFAASVRLTAQLRQNKDYQDASARADATPLGEAEPVGATIARHRAARRTR